MHDNLRLAVLVSGQGSALRYLFEASEVYDFEIVFVGADRDCPALKQPLERHIPYQVYRHIGREICWTSGYPAFDIDLICLAGFCRKVNVIDKWENRVMNVHPALMPALSGKGMYGQRVFQAMKERRVQILGCTVHFCDNKFDHGPIILQQSVSIDPSSDLDTMIEAVHNLEKKAFPIAIEAFRRCYNGQTPDAEQIAETAYAFLHRHLQRQNKRIL